MKWIPSILFALSASLATLAAALQAEGPVGLRMIVVQTESQATAILARLQAGEKFDQLARTQSADSSARDGGYLGLVTISQLRKEFQEALQGIRPGQFSPVVKIGREFALLQLLTDDETRAIELRNAKPVPSPRTLQQLWATALSRNSVDAIKEVLASGAPAHVVYDDGSTVLMGAAESGQTVAVRALLDAGASVHAHSLDGSTALTIAAFGGHLDIVRMLLAAGADANAPLRDGSTALMKASQAGHAEVVLSLIALGANVNTRASNGLTALMEASFGGHAETAQFLIQSRADVNAALSNGSTSLMAAAEKGHPQIAAALIAAGANVKAKSSTGGTALMEAAYSGHIELVRLLLKSGSEIDAASSTGATALMGAALAGKTEVVAALLEASANPDLKDSRGWLALTHARASANPATVRLLLGKTTGLSPAERNLITGSAYLNEYYASSDGKLLDLATTEFQRVITAEPQNATALEWLGAIEVLRFGEAPTLAQYRKAAALLKKSVDLDPKDPDRQYWMAAVNSVFASNGKGASAAELAAIVDQGIEHAKKAIELDPEFADAMDHLSVLYRRKGDTAAADTARANAVRIRTRRDNRPSRFNDQFSRPAVPPPKF